MACPCCWAGALCAVTPLAQRLSSTPAGKGALVALAPFLCLVTALALGAVDVEQLRETAECVASCECMRSYAIGVGVLWLLAIQGAMRSGAKTLPKSDEPLAAPPMPERVNSKKLAAKAA